MIIVLLKMHINLNITMTKYYINIITIDCSVSFCYNRFVLFYEKKPS